jgi:hypothetical protein
MGEDSKLGWKIKGQISRFAGRLSQGGDKARRRFMSEMLYAIQAAEDVKISNLARALNEEIALIKTENRLCRNLSEEDLTEAVNRRLCWEGGVKVEAETVLAVDLGDVQKRYAKKMENLAQVRDGSTGEIGTGYWLCEVVAAHPYGDQLVPLYGELYSQAAEDFESENAQILKAVEMVAAATGKRGIYALDRGGDRRKIILPMLDADLRFVIRQDGDRHVVMPGGKKCAVAEAARWCACRTEREVEVEREGFREVKHLRLGALPVRLPERPETRVWLVVIRGFGEEPILLLSNVVPNPDREYATWIADVYLTRWKCEESYRFLKQSYQLEDVRVRSYVGLRNLYVLVQAVFYFVSVVIGAKAKLNLIFKKVCAKAKRFYEVANFFQYAVADGIHRLLFASRTGPHHARPPRENGQLAFSFAHPPA